MTEQEEEFIHFVSCIKCLNRVLRMLNRIKAAQSDPLVGYAFRFALVEYAKPYNASRGAIKNKHKLDTSCIPPDLLALHARIINSRDQVHAHFDLTVMEAKLYISEIQGQRFTSIVQKIINGVEELPNIDEIQVLIERTLDNMYIKEKNLENALPSALHSIVPQ